MTNKAFRAEGPDGAFLRFAAVAFYDDLPVVGGVQFKGGGVEGGALQVVGHDDVGRGVAGFQQEVKRGLATVGVVEVPGQPGVEALAGSVGGGDGIGEGGARVMAGR